jgi:hypothetical protein
MTDIGGGKAAADIENDPANQKLIADQQAAAAAGNVDGGGGYPRTFDAHTRMVDSTNGHEFIGTQWSYNTEAEALAKIDSARASNKYVMYANPEGGSYINELSADDFRVNIED